MRRAARRSADCHDTYHEDKRRRTAYRRAVVLFVFERFPNRVCKSRSSATREQRAKSIEKDRILVTRTGHNPDAVGRSAQPPYDAFVRSTSRVPSTELRLVTRCRPSRIAPRLARPRSPDARARRSTSRARFPVATVSWTPRCPRACLRGARSDAAYAAAAPSPSTPRTSRPCRPSPTSPRASACRARCVLRRPPDVCSQDDAIADRVASLSAFPPPAIRSPTQFPLSR